MTTRELAEIQQQRQLDARRRSNEDTAPAANRPPDEPQHHQCSQGCRWAPEDGPMNYPNEH